MKIISKVLIFNKDNRVLILKRSNTHPNSPGHYDLPGGEIETDEDPIQAAVREVKEEAGLDISPQNVTFAFDKQHGNKVKHLLYQATISDTAPEVALSWEHSAYVWLTPAQICEYGLPDGTDAYYRDVFEHLNS